MDYTFSKIRDEFGNKLIGNGFMRRMICKTLLFFPDNIVKKITEKVWFVSSFDDGWAFAIRGDELEKDEALVFLSDELLKEDERQIVFTIAHEIGHIILGHRNSIGKAQTPREVRKQEREADEFAEKYLQLH